jgi:ferritin-like metal-binding protein YciE
MKLNSLQDLAPAAARDAALIASAQRVEHYEIAAYGNCRTSAARLGLQDRARLPQQKLDEEGATGRRLTVLAKSYVNEEAESAR